MSITSEILRIQGAKADIKAALESKGLTVSSSLLIDDYADLIDSIPSGQETRIVAKYNVTDTTNATSLHTNNSWFSEMEIDGVVQGSVVNSYLFDTTGEHIVKYTFSNNAIKNDGYSIGTALFYGTNLKSVILPNTVVEVYQMSFMNCSQLEFVRLDSTTPPTLAVNALQSTNDCPIYVPSASVSAYQSANGWSTYSSRIRAIPSI